MDEWETKWRAKWRTHQFYLVGHPLGLKGSIKLANMLGHDECQFWQPTLSKCQLATLAGCALHNTGSANIDNAMSTEAVIDAGKQLCGMPQSCTITQLNLDGNSFTKEGIHILAGFMYLCPQLERLYCNDCEITSDDLKLLLDHLTELKSSVSNLCGELICWSLINNEVDDTGVCVLLDHIPSLFPFFGYYKHGGVYLANNKVSKEMLKKLEEEVRRREEVNLYACEYCS